MFTRLGPAYEEITTGGGKESLHPSSPHHGLIYYYEVLKIPRFSVSDLNRWIGVNARVVVAPFARSHLWCICAAVSVGSQCVVTRFARRHLWGICAAVSVESKCVVRLASLVGTYRVFVPRSVLEHSA